MESWLVDTMQRLLLANNDFVIWLWLLLFPFHLQINYIIIFYFFQIKWFGRARRIRTATVRILSPLSLPLEYRPMHLSLSWVSLEHLSDYCRFLTSQLISKPMGLEPISAAPSAAALSIELKPDNNRVALLGNEVDPFYSVRQLPQFIL